MTNPQPADNPCRKAPGEPLAGIRMNGARPLRARRRKAPGEPLPGGRIDGAPEPLQNGVWRWTAGNAQDGKASPDDTTVQTIIDWHEADDGQDGWYIVTCNSNGDPLVRTGPYSHGPFDLERALEQTFPPSYDTEPGLVEAYSEEIAEMFHDSLRVELREAAVRLAADDDTDDDGNSEDIERLQRTCDYRRIWMSR